MTPPTPAPPCIEVGDIYRTPPSAAPPAEIAEIIAENADHRTLYLALSYLLQQDFDFQNLPPEPIDFCNSTALTPADKARYAAIHGLMLADNWTDPALGKTDAGDGDQTITDPKSGAPIIIAKRFADAVVAAVQEYTQRSVLFQKVYGFLQNEATAGGNGTVIGQPIPSTTSKTSPPAGA